MTEPAIIDRAAPAAEAMPGVVLGVEQEYKWRIEPPGLLCAGNPTLDDLEALLPPPRRAERELRFRHTQSTVYFDDGWQLTDNRIALRATVNPGAAKDVSWLGIKQTISWRDGCRDSLEVNERVDPRSIGQWDGPATVPMDYLRGLRGDRLAPAAYGYVVQQRHKLFFRTEHGFVLQLTFDETTFHPLPRNGEALATRWLEIENNTSDLRARHELDVWAAAVTERLGRPPCHQAKSEVAAELAGWRRR